MSGEPVTVAIPVRNGGALLAHTLAAVRSQRTSREVQLLVCDSGSTDGSAAVARGHGAQVIEIDTGAFSHGGTRNLLMERAAGAHILFLSQDAEPADEDWLETLVGGFGLGEDVALAFGPYRARPGAPVWVARELEQWFSSFSPDSQPRVDRLSVGESPTAAALLGPRAFFTSANGAVARWAWERVPFPAIPYAEDHALALAVLRAGWAKAFVPAAAALHSHAYPPAAHFRRCFDEWRGLREVYGHREPAGPRHAASTVGHAMKGDMAVLRAQGASGGELARGAAGSLVYHGLRRLGAIAGSRADRLPSWLRRRLSLEGRGTFLAGTRSTA
jgi:rhamnosyltransferase